MIVLSRFRVSQGDDVLVAATSYARIALAEFARTPGFRSGSLARAVDDPELWVLVTSWDGAGSYRRALGRFEVRMALMPISGFLLDEPSAFEPVEVAEGGSDPRTVASVRADDADSAGPGSAEGPT